MKPATPYIQLHQRKRTWTPLAVSAGKTLPGGEETLKRALSLRVVELPVGEFIKEAMKGDLPAVEGCKELLLSNAEDEIKHDMALNYAAAVHKIPENIQAEANKIGKAWIELDRHPVLKAAILERSVFFVLLPIFRFLGDTGLRSISADISRDEMTHVAAHSMVCKEIGASADKVMNQMRRATVNWVIEPLKAENSNKHLSSNFWMNCSDNLYRNGKAPELAETRASRQPAFFEASNVDLPQYA